MKDYLLLMRVKHYIKNTIVFLPLFFGGELFVTEKLKKATVGFVCFCLLSSGIYILNDCRDLENDRNHPTKKNRPLASGKICVMRAMLLMLICVFIAFLISILFTNMISTVYLLTYLFLNIGYSMGLKNKSIIDVAIVASGFVIRLLYGGSVTDIVVSKWLFLVVVTGSLYMALGKRRNELQKQTDSRTVLRYYNIPFLDKNMYVCVSLAIVFYSLWSFNMKGNLMLWSVPAVILILMRYSLDVESDSDGDPVEVIMRDKVLLGLILLFGLCMFLMLYYT